MTIKLEDAQTLTYLAIRLRQETYGCGPWDHAGTFSVIRELIGQNYAETLHRIVGHAMDPEARTPGAIKRPFVPKRQDEPGRRMPAKPAEECRLHVGEYVGSCRACAVQHIDAPTDPILDDPDRSAGRQLREQLRARRLGVAPDPSPAHGVGAPSEPLAPPVSQADEGDDHGPASAGEPDDRPETACAADGCYRPTRDGICDRCREKAAAEDIAAANVELVDRLKTQQWARAHDRPPADPGPPRYFTGADINHDRVHAAQAEAAEQRSNA